MGAIARCPVLGTEPRIAATRWLSNAVSVPDPQSVTPFQLVERLFAPVAAITVRHCAAAVLMTESGWKGELGLGEARSNYALSCAARHVALRVSFADFRMIL
jgi:hypothetical protein